MSDLRVSFPEPCSERWEVMALRGCNRHCASCDKVIHDLSAMTIEDVEALLAIDPEPCVRAIINDGKVRTKPSTNRRRLAVAIGSSLSLAACQTIVGPPKASGSIRGNIAIGEDSSGPDTIRARDDTGKIYRATIERAPNNREFRIVGLPSGTYQITFSETSCSNGPKLRQINNVVISNGEVDMGTINWDTLCAIYIGMLKIESPRVG